MTFDYIRILDVTTIPSTVASIYNNPAGKKTYIRLIALHNANTTAETVTLHQVPDNATAVGTAADTNRIFKMVMEPDQTIHMDLPAPGLLLTDTNDSIQAVTTTASRVTITITGGQE